MKQGIRLETAWPAMIGTMIGVEIMLSMFFLSGPASITSETRAGLTHFGAMCFIPEYDLPLYVIGCLLTFSLIIGLAWLQRRQLSCVETTPEESHVKNLMVDSPGLPLRHTQTDQRNCFVQRRWSQIVQCGILFLLHLFVMLVVQRPFTLSDYHMPLLPAASLFLLPLILFCIVIFRWYLPLSKCPLWIAARPETAPPIQHAHLHRWLDWVIPMLVVAVVYIPDYSILAGKFFLQDRFHHWDYYSMGPTLAFHYGKALGTAFYTQYGVGWPLLYHALAQLIPITYGHMLQISVIYGSIYFIGIYVLLILILRNRMWAAAGLFFALTLHLFSGNIPDSVLWTFPSSTILRSPVDVWFLIFILLHARTARALWLRLAAAMAGAAMIFGTDTGIYLSATFVTYLFYLQSLPRTNQNLIRRQISLALQCAAIALLVLLPILWIAGRGTLLHKDFWTGWLESLIVFGGGFGALPISAVDSWALLLFALGLGLYLGTIGATLVKLPRRNNMPENVFLACLSTYGLATLLLFIGRSHPCNLFHVSVPFSIVAVATLARWSDSWEPVESLPPKCATNKAEQPLAHLLPWGRLLPWGALVVATTLMVTKRDFQQYPGILQSFFRAPAPAGLCLLKKSGDVCGLPAEAQGYAAMFDAVISRMKDALASGRTIAVLDDADPIFYLAADAPPWYRYSPLFPAFITRASLAQFVRQVAEHGPEVVVIRANPAGYPDVWRAAHETVVNHYRLDSTVGIFEFWHRK